MGEEIAFENGWISDFQGLVTFTFDWGRRQPSLKWNKLSVDGRTNVWTGGRTFYAHVIRSTQRSRPKKGLGLLWA